MNNLLSEEDTKTVLDILVEQLGVEQSQLTFDADIEQDLGADSLLKIETAMAVEERFGISIPDEVLEKVSTVGDLFDALADVMARTGRHLD